MTNIAIIQARMTSSRLPGKMLLPIKTKPAIEWVIDSAKQIKGIDKIVLATSGESTDDVLANFSSNKGIECFRGNLNNVLQRFYDAATKYNASNIIRITGDCTFLDPDICSGILYMLQDSGYDYVSNALNPTFPDGLDCEAFTMQTLRNIYKKSEGELFTEHVTTYINYNRSLFNIGHYTSPLNGLAKHRWTLDTQADYEFLCSVASHL
ncbi:unnamed protein product, partial [Ectocarpus sp. 12 AP-2014]